MGLDLARALRRELPEEPDAEQWRFVREVGHCLQQKLARSGRRFDFLVVREAAPNAFALPGGFVFVTRSLLELIEYQTDELAFVLGHELGHVTARHAMDRVMSDAAVGAACRLLRVGGGAGAWLQSAGAQLLKSAHSQRRELEADRRGVTLCRAAGFDGCRALGLLERLREHQAAAPENSLLEYFASHPPFEQRLGEICKVLA